MAGLRGRGRLLGCSCYLGLGSVAPAPRFLGTQPPYATQALIIFNYNNYNDDNNNLYSVTFQETIINKCSLYIIKTKTNSGCS